MKIVIFFVSFFFSCGQLSAQKNATAVLIDQLATLNNWNYEDDLDIDSLVHATGSNLVQLLEQEVLHELDSLDNFSSNSSPDDCLHWYTFFYHSGGTSGYISNTVFQWKKSDGTYGAYAIYPAHPKSKLSLEMSFYESYKLPAKNKNLYLLIGNQKGSSRLEIGTALVVQLKNDYLILDYPAFPNKSTTLSFFDYIDSGEGACIACVEYDEKNSTITINDMGEEDFISCGQHELDTKKKSVVFHFDRYHFVLKK